jgi:hypothetical protein
MQRRPGELEARLQRLRKRVDDAGDFLEIIGLDSGGRRLLGHRMEHELEVAPRWRDSGFHGVENMRRGELIHGDGETLAGLAEKALQLAPAGLRTDADGELHAFFHERQIRRLRRRVGAGLRRSEDERLVADDETLESGSRRPGRAE